MATRKQLKAAIHRRQHLRTRHLVGKTRADSSCQRIKLYE
jgi:hypothetical protein